MNEIVLQILTDCYTDLNILLTQDNIPLVSLQTADTQIKESIEPRYHFDGTKYPRLGFTLNLSDIQPFLKQDNDLNVAEEFVRLTEENPLAKLLFATLWKNGDLKKVKHIVNGIADVSNGEDIRQGPQTNGWVFYQFGRHLANPDEPIVDQHTVRAFKILTKKSDMKIPTGSTLLTRDNLLAYREWIAAIGFSDEEKTDCQHLLDKMLFTLGKAAKNVH